MNRDLLIHYFNQHIYYIIFIGCQPQLHTAPSGIIRSPGYPNNYFDNANCVYNITVQDGKAIKIEFSTFDLESSSSCQYDKLQIFEGKSSAPKATLCGSGAKTYTSRGNKVFMRFTSDGSVTRQGFYGTYQTVDRRKSLHFKIITVLNVFRIKSLCSTRFSCYKNKLYDNSMSRFLLQLRSFKKYTSLILF